jgi:hypothetical protein
VHGVQQAIALHLRFGLECVDLWQRDLGPLCSADSNCKVELDYRRLSLWSASKACPSANQRIVRPARLSLASIPG